MNRLENNVSARIAELACRNLASKLCRVNDIRNYSVIRVRILDREGLLEAIWRVCRGGSVDGEAEAIANAVAVTSKRKLAHTVNKKAVMAESVAASVAARSAQSRLATLFAVEEYLRVAYDYDQETGGTGAMSLALDSVRKLYSGKMLYDFILRGRPQVDPGAKARLADRAFDRRYAFSSEMDVRSMAHKRYVSKFLPRDDFFLKKSAGPVDKARTASSRVPVPTVQPVGEIDIRLFRRLNVMEYAEMPLHNKRRKLVNLNARSRDLFECPVPVLPAKQRFLSIELRTKRSYIYSCYANGLRVGMNGKETAEYYMLREAEMYQEIWHTDESVYCDGETITLHTGTVLQVPPDRAPYEILHEANAVYAALFGFTPDDAASAGSWQWRSARQAYTDEGLANYRYAVVNARLSGVLR